MKKHHSMLIDQIVDPIKLIHQQLLQQLYKQLYYTFFFIEFSLEFKIKTDMDENCYFFYIYIYCENLPLI